MTGKKLKALRKASGLSQKALAAKLEVHTLTVSRWERDERKISKPMAKLITLALDRSPQS